MSFQRNESLSQNYESVDIDDNVDQLIDKISESGHELQTKQLILEEMKRFLSQISILNKLKDGIILLPFDYKLSIRANECQKYALLLSIDQNYLTDINIKPDYWRFNLQIETQQIDHEFCLTQCESIELNKFLSSDTVLVFIELSESQYECLPLLINVSLILEMPQNLIKHVFQSSDLSQIQTLFHIQLTQWTLNEFHFLSFIRCVDQCYDYKELVSKDLKSMNRLEDLGSNEREAKLYRNTIFVMIETINIGSNDKICSDLIKYLIPKEVPVDCIVVNDNNKSASVEAFYFGHEVKLIASICESEPKFLDITIEAQNIRVITTIRKSLIESLSNMNPLLVIDSNKISLSTEHRSKANDLIDRLNCVNDNKDVTDIYMDVRHEISEKLALI